MEAGESPTWMQERVLHGGTREWHVKAGMSATRGCHVEGCDWPSPHSSLLQQWHLVSLTSLFSHPNRLAEAVGQRAVTSAARLAHLAASPA